MTLAPDSTAITSAEELRELLGAPLRRAIDKERLTLHAWDREWLARTPFCLISTSDADGNCDVSPKGDPPGFMNVLSNPHVGLIFLIPGRTETLRVNGRATLVRDAPFFDEMVVKGHRPALALVVDIQLEQYYAEPNYAKKLYGA